MKFIVLLIAITIGCFKCEDILKNASLALSESNWDEWRSDWKEKGKTYLVFIGADNQETRQLESIWLQLDLYIRQQKLDINLSHLLNYMDYIKGKKELDVIGYPTIYLFKNKWCYFYSWSLEINIENLVWFIQNGQMFYPPVKCPNHGSFAFTTTRVIQDAYIVPLHAIMTNEKKQKEIGTILAVLGFGCLYSLIFRRKKEY